MDITKKRRLSERALGFFLLSHPLPVLVHLLAVTVFTLLAAWPHLVWSTIALVIAAHSAMQVSIAILNDYCDRHTDALSKKEKPIPRGLISPREALIAGLLMIALMIFLLLPLPPLALLISFAYLALGQSYNLGLKSTPLSGLVFALAMPLIPLYAFAALDHMPPILFWLVPVGCFLGIALNLANSLPDLEEDKANRARTLAVVLGVRRSLLACPMLILLSIALIALLTITSAVPAQVSIIAPTLGICSLAGGGMFLFFNVNKSMYMLYFYLVVFICLLLTGGWFIGVLI